MNISQKRWQPSRGFLITLGILLILSIIGRPTLRFAKAQYDIYKGSKAILIASETTYQSLLATIKANQPNQTLSQVVPVELMIPEKIFQTAILPDLLGRSSQYEPYTHNGKLACAWMVNMVIYKALGDRIGVNPLYVPSMVEALDNKHGYRLPQDETKRGDLAISNGTDYEKGLWHIGICMNNGCTLVLSNSPLTSRFEWLSDANFDGAFAHFPGKTTFYRVTMYY